MKKILVVDDDPEVLDYLGTLLRNEGTVIPCVSSEKATHVLAEQDIDLLVVDLNFEGEEKDGIFVLDRVANEYPMLPVIVLSGDKMTSRIVSAMKHKIFEFIPKEGEFYKALLQSVKKALIYAQKTSTILERGIFETQSPKMLEVLEQVKRISMSESRSPILILGESGTGKEIMARYIAQLVKKRIVVANMAAIPQDIAEAELFGAVQGAYTGATSNRRGLIPEAENGIFFLDEVGDCSAKVQASLLRTIQENEVKAVGATQTQRVNVRFLAATNKDLTQMVAKGEFREDLLERLSTFPIRLLPLRERREDIILYTERFLQALSPNHKFYLSPDGERALINYHWPRNVRELRNTVERIIALSPTRNVGSEVVRKALFLGVEPQAIAQTLSDRPQLPNREELIRKWKLLGGNRRRTAKAFGVHYQTFLRWLSAYGIEDLIPGRVGRPRLGKATAEPKESGVQCATGKN